MTDLNHITDAIVSFKKIAEIGQEGKNSNVFLAHDQHLDTEIVVKQIQKNGISLNKLFAESRVLYSVAHTNIAPIQYACRDDENIYITMPYYKEGSLKQLISKENLTLRQIIKYSIDILTGLMHIHSKGLIHFDIKSDNILISNNNTALVADFGISAYIDETTGLADIKSFYRNTMPPELILSTDGKFDRRFDLYHFGLILYQMCCGIDVYNTQKAIYGTPEAFARAIVQGDFPNRNVFPVHIPKEIRKLLNNILNPDLSKRPDNALAIVNSLANIPEEFLDWNYIKHSDQEFEWFKILDNKTVKLVKTLTGFMATKTMHTTGSCTKISKYSGTLSEDQVRDFFISGG